MIRHLPTQATPTHKHPPGSEGLLRGGLEPSDLLLPHPPRSPPSSPVGIASPGNPLIPWPRRRAARRPPTRRSSARSGRGTAPAAFSPPRRWGSAAAERVGGPGTERSTGVTRHSLLRMDQRFTTAPAFISKIWDPTQLHYFFLLYSPIQQIGCTPLLYYVPSSVSLKRSGV